MSALKGGASGVLLAAVFVLWPASPARAGKDHPAPHWGYDGKEGPEKWGDLVSDYATCKTGKTQSPVELETHDAKQAHEIDFHYSESGLKLVDNGHTIQVNYEKGSSIEVDGKHYDLLQFHFHTPSEHTIEHKSWPLELHIVHRTPEGKLGVLGIMIAEGKKNEFIEKLWRNLPAKAHQEKVVSAEHVNVADVVPENHTYYHYEGSLTTPPCSEGVNWMVLTTPIEASKQQIQVFKKRFKHNARPVQPLYGRHVDLW